ncbi:MAG: hypothetical protein ACK5BX_16575, partial [Bradyrhizobium sp.]
MTAASNQNPSNRWHVGLIGYGEVGKILAEDLRKDGVRVSALHLRHLWPLPKGLDAIFARFRSVLVP